jgi:hypothetical protein
MNHTRVLHSVEGFLKQHSGKDFCIVCVIKYARISKQDDQDWARHVLLTSDWGKRVKLGICIRCDKIAETWRWEFPGVRMSTDKP